MSPPSSSNPLCHPSSHPPSPQLATVPSRPPNSHPSFPLPLSPCPPLSISTLHLRSRLLLPRNPFLLRLPLCFRLLRSLLLVTSTLLLHQPLQLPLLLFTGLFLSPFPLNTGSLELLFQFRESGHGSFDSSADVVKAWGGGGGG